MKLKHHDKYLQALKEIEETGVSKWEFRNPMADAPDEWLTTVFDVGGQQPSFYAHIDYRKPPHQCIDGEGMTEKRLNEIIRIIYHSMRSPNYDEAVRELIEFAESHFTKPKLYQQRVEIPEPVRDAGVMNYDQQYFTPNSTSKEKFTYFHWHGDVYDLYRLKNGLVYLAKEDAIKRTDAGLAVEYES